MARYLIWVKYFVGVLDTAMPHKPFLCGSSNGFHHQVHNYAEVSEWETFLVSNFRGRETVVGRSEIITRWPFQLVPPEKVCQSAVNKKLSSFRSFLAGCFGISFTMNC